MIAANELRIGNWYISTKWQKPVRCELSDIVDIYDRNMGAEDKYAPVEEVFQPLPLTEEWLLKFGFEKEDSTPSKGHGNYYSMGICDYKYSFAYAGFRKDWGFYNSYTDAADDKDNNRFDFISCGIQSVHQLQNLFFALTGEELTITE
jgi:hypothetical protein